MSVAVGPDRPFRLGAILLVTVGTCVAALAGSSSLSAGSTASYVTPEATRARNLDDPGTASAVGAINGTTEAVCTLRAWNGTKARKGVKGNLIARLLDLETFAEVARFDSRRVRTNRRGEASVTYAVNSTGDPFVGVLLVDVNVAGNKRVTRVSLTCGFDG